MFNSWISRYYKSLIITENWDPQSQSQIQIKNLQNSLNFSHTFFTLIHQISLFFVLSLVLIIICRCYWRTVEEELWKNLAKSWLLKLMHSHGSWEFHWIQALLSWILAFIHLLCPHSSSVFTIGGLKRTNQDLPHPRG